MKKIVYTGLLCLATLVNFAQSTNSLYGIVRQNYYSTVTDPFDSTITYQNFDSATIRLGYSNPATGFVGNIGTSTYNQLVNLTGAAINPYDSSYTFMGGTNLNTFSMSTGQFINQVPLSNPIAPSYFDNFRFNNSDSTIYGLARRNTYNPVTMQTVGEVYLAKVNTQTGVITQISPNSVAFGFALAGSAIDPYQMVYYFSSGSFLYGLDIYNGSVFTKTPITVTNGIAFDNFTYSCADTGLYGLIRQNYFSYVINPLFPTDSFPELDSTSIKLGRINPATGIVTTISPSSIAQGGYSLNAGAAIDPTTMTYYFSNGNEMLGVSLITGLLTSKSPYVFAAGQFFDLMRNFENCIAAVATRPRPITLGIKDAALINDFELFPNPTENTCLVKNSKGIKQISLLSIDGREIMNSTQQSTQASIDLSGLEKGVYLIKIIDSKDAVSLKRVVRN
jgi:Secretion system C-terminal sorting domain